MQVLRTETLWRRGPALSASLLHHLVHADTPRQGAAQWPRRHHHRVSCVLTLPLRPHQDGPWGKSHRDVSQSLRQTSAPARRIHAQNATTVTTCNVSHNPLAVSRCMCHTSPPPAGSPDPPPASQSGRRDGPDRSRRPPRPPVPQRSALTNMVAQQGYGHRVERLPRERRRDSDGGHDDGACVSSGTSSCEGTGGPGAPGGGGHRVRVTVTCDEHTHFSHVGESDGTRAEAIEAAAIALLPQVRARAAADNTRPVVDLMDLFHGACAHKAVVDLSRCSSDSAMACITLWIEQCVEQGIRPVVGVDCEGIGSTPPALVQMAGPGFIAFDFPAARTPPALSRAAQAILDDDRVTKVLCYGRHDIQALKLGPKRHGRARHRGQGDGDPVVDVADQVTRILGKSGQLGLTRCVALALPGVRFKKPPFHRHFVDIDHGRTAAPRALIDLPPEVQAYAAMDAWLVLQLHYLLQRRIDGQGDSLTSWDAEPDKAGGDMSALEWCVSRINAVPHDVPMCDLSGCSADRGASAGQEGESNPSWSWKSWTSFFF
eukprot:m.211739 g.211739  ORF g.211739 m.211739 type:complete len:544 (-) comp25647_c0_seq1:161-1792(-)